MRNEFLEVFDSFDSVVFSLMVLAADMVGAACGVTSTD
jgi:hypothetical protein